MGRNGGCRFCKRYGPGDPHEAVRDMRRAGFEPLEPFTNIRTPWLALCERCGEVSSPKLNNVRTRGECCAHCATYGLDPGAPAWLYVLAHAGLSATKIGITGQNTREDRLVRFEGLGWTVEGRIAFGTGEAAYKIEQAAINQLRLDFPAPFLTAAQVPCGGWTETFDAALVPAALLLAQLTASAACR
ncbi:hypothetical protein ABT237_35970 [Streptomyces sp. NPDC001581]|uniref:hypothetical protein n=1 Tax=Streptomyces sp. NPDC001581 TaxID=3154386 RepID=UPI00331E8B5C